MAQRSARETALAALRLWREKRCFADSIISGLLANADLTASDRAFALELFYGSLRNLTLLDFWISRLRASRIETNLRDILRLGLYQVFILKTAEHAAVHETVAIAPQNQRPGIFLQLYPHSRPLPGNSDFVELNTLPAAALESGHCYIQDPSTVSACELLEPQSGEKILDACAAPGGKTTYLAQLMQDRGTIIACDRDAQRLQILKDNTLRLGTTIVRAIRHDWTRDDVPKEIAVIAPFDRVLVDAPCTNTGVIRRRIDVRWRLRSSSLSSVAYWFTAHAALSRKKMNGSFDVCFRFREACGWERKKLRCRSATVLMAHSPRNCSKHLTQGDRVASRLADGMINGYARRAIRQTRKTFGGIFYSPQTERNGANRGV